ncbi:hypothetical protein RD792_015049 [Penstemon davidsonii]|uniref:Protein kinase domain-containing protein n=1 Tax=Penstemon davidsonii TaxID=160366 RepID=A0ABR0CSJ5_9LAMI|nr:hypothetical protein RD792_015049 [Penstemon davidsonii]
MAIIQAHDQPFIFLYIILLIFPITSSISDSDALLKFKQSFTNATSLDSWEPGTDPCAENNQWVGIICENRVVSGLRLGRLGLSGRIDVDALLYISGLRSIAVMSNSFSGPIPDFHRLGALKALYITGNQFSGEIPSDYFSRMEGLRKIWLSGNRFSGRVPYSLVQLSHLMELHLEDNQFSGGIPPFEQRSLISLDLSNNNLEGEIPSSLLKFSPSSFRGNPMLCGGNMGKPCGDSSSKLDRIERSQNAMKISIWFLLASFAILLAMVAGIYVMRRKQESFDMLKANNLDDPLRFSSSSMAKKDIRSGSSKKGIVSGHRAGSGRKGSMRAGDLVIINNEKGEFGLGDLMKSAAEVLGNGALGSSYKATMANGSTVVVKRIKEMSKMGKDQFDAEMRRLGRLKHTNVLAPLAYHYRKDEKLLVYEYQPKGSLLFLLHGDRGVSHTELNWPARFKIIQGIARGLDYLHIELSLLDLPHGDLKSSNVLLTPNNEPLLVDYGFCSLISSSQAAQALSAYKCPEAMYDHNISPKCDVYCLGIIILEILTGKFPCQYLNNGKGGTDLVQWVRSAIGEGREADLYDPDIANTRNCLGEIEQLLRIGAACTESNVDKRLDIREAIKRIESVGVEGSYQDTKTFTVMPTLKDGYADKLPEAP